jgi:RNA polymerase sigma-70 factor (ECF subfamily)
MMMRKPKNDAALVRLVAQGNQNAFLELYDHYSSRVYGLAIRMLGEEMAAEEVTQDTFLKLWTRADSYSPLKGTLLTWLLTITRRTAIDRIRLENRRPDLGGVTQPDALWATLPAPHSATQESRWRSLHFAVLELPDEQRQVIELAYFHGMSQSQIADYLEIPLGTVKTRVRLSMDKLRQSWMVDDSTDPNSKVST